LEAGSRDSEAAGKGASEEGKWNTSPLLTLTQETLSVGA
jgi:hypothetical protein